jgi:SAM-dependent methyltransferase
MLTGHEPWLPDELSMAGRENLDAAHVERYDQKEDADGAAEVAAVFDLGLSADPTVIEFGPGTGQFTIEMAARAAAIYAVDVSPVMLDRLNKNLARREITNVATVRAGFLTYQHQGAPADLVYSRYALHHLPDFWKALALARIAGLLKPGGLFRLWDVVYSFDSTEAPQALENWMTAVAGESISDEWVRDELDEHVRDEHSTFSWLLEPMITRAGLIIEHADYSADRICAKYVCRKPAP